VASGLALDAVGATVGIRKNLEKSCSNDGQLFSLKNLQKRGSESMKVWTFLVELKNGDVFSRGEWGRTAESAGKAIRSAYGENLEKLEVVLE